MQHNFDQIIAKIDIEDLKSFLTNHKKPIYESILYKRYFGKINNSEENQKLLFQKHFCLFHLLYKIQEDFEKINKYLHIHFMRIKLIDYPAIDHCHYFNEEEMKFCDKKVASGSKFCSFHSDLLHQSLENLSSKYFYLDESNFHFFSTEKFRFFKNSSFEIIKNYKFYQKSLQTMGLPDNTDFIQLQKRFRHLAKKYHPDISGFNRSKFIEINNSYQFLKRIISNIE
ncbi:MAG: DNA-J related domain-containing protein [Candidatus Cloacimonadota bacterium]|nr:DNA-J related domain-containing protein [Candidatus Cloacimonadota bacterium]